MALLAVIDKKTHEQLPDLLKAEYKERDGRLFLDVANTEVDLGGGKKAVYALEDVHGLKSALQKERTELGDIKTKFRDFENLDPKEVRAKLARLEELEAAPPSEKNKNEIESIKRQLTEKYSADLSKKDGEYAKLERFVEELLVDNSARTALAKYQLVPGGDVLLMPHIKSQMRIHKMEDGRREARVIDRRDPKIDMVSLRQGNTGFMDVDELIERMSQDKVYAVAFAGSGASGNAGEAGDGRGGGSSRRSGGSGSADDEEGGGQVNRNNGIHRRAADPAQAITAARESMARKGSR